jgi:hypothetical protein
MTAVSDLFRNSSVDELTRPLSLQRVDYSEGRSRDWVDVAKDVGLIFLKVVIFPWGLYCAGRYGCQRIAMATLIVAQNSFIQWLADYHIEAERSYEAKDIAQLVAKIILIPWGLCSLVQFAVYKLALKIIGDQKMDALRIYSPKELPLMRQLACAGLVQAGFTVRHVVLEKNGLRYSGLMIYKPGNQRWVLHVGGNADIAEQLADRLPYSEEKSNILLINPPGVGLSEGEATPQTFSDGVAVGISFLEKKVHAKTIFLSGFSAGGAALGQALLQHQPVAGVRYRVLFQKTFSRFSDIASKWVGTWAGKWIKSWGWEMDSVQASRHLQTHGIKQIIVQGGIAKPPCPSIAPTEFAHDGVIPSDASLAYAISTQDASHIPCHRRRFMCDPDGHIPVEIVETIQQAYPPPLPPPPPVPQVAALTLPVLPAVAEPSLVTIAWNWFWSVF